MNKKIIIIALLIFVVFIWIKLALDFFKYKDDEPSSEGISISKVPQPILEVSNFEYELDLNYKDPFLKQVRNQKVKIPSRVRRPKPEKKKEELPKVNVKWPKVEYLGGITSSTGAQSSVILKVNGEESILHEGGINNKVSLVSIYEDSLVISYMEELKTIIR